MFERVSKLAKTDRRDHGGLINSPVDFFGGVRRRFPGDALLSTEVLRLAKDFPSLNSMILTVFGGFPS